MKHKISKNSFDDDDVNHSHIPKFVYNFIFSDA
jgi:hypothetical protein